MAKKTAPPKRGSVEVLPPDTSAEDLALVQADGSIITSFLKGAAAFFTRATTLERGAMQLEAESKLLVMPDGVEADSRMQTFIKIASTKKKEVEEHWGICQAVSQLHRKLTAKRSVAVQALERAQATAQTFHNRYAEQERRRAAEEQDRLRREAEDRARADRERELADLERLAIQKEEQSSDLSAREQTFVERYFEAGDGIAAARFAGFKDPAQQASRLLSMPKILAAIDAKRQAKAARDQAEALRQAPVEYTMETVKPNIARTAGSYDRSTWTAEILDAAALVRAVVEGKHGIPLDVLVPDQTKLNEYARSLEARLDLWPGVRAKKKTTTV